MRGPYDRERPAARARLLASYARSRTPETPAGGYREVATHLIVEVPGIPLTVTGKKMEVPVRRILTGTPVDTAVGRESMANPEVLEAFVAYAASRSSDPEVPAERNRNRPGKLERIL